MDSRSRKPKPEGPIGRGERTDSERPEWQKRVQRDKPTEKSPLVPFEITPEDLDMSVRVQLKTLTAENAEMVARHLAMVGLLINDDPNLAHKHALAASRRAGRLAIVHETLGLTAYASQDFALAIRELQTHRRLSGGNDQLPILVDAERGMGRPQKALEIVTGIDRSKLAVGVRINLAIALSGARLDLGQPQLALEELEIPELSPKSIFPQSPLLFSCYAEVLRELGRDATEWDSLAERADAALANVDGEIVELFEEIHIPTSEEFDRTAKKPFDKDRKPFDKDRKPFDKDRKPFDKDRKPFDKDRKPFDKDRKPFDKDRKPFDKDRKPKTSGGKSPGFTRGKDLGKGEGFNKGRGGGNASR